MSKNGVSLDIKKKKNMKRSPETEFAKVLLYYIYMSVINSAMMITFIQ